MTVPLFFKIKEKNGNFSHSVNIMINPKINEKTHIFNNIPLTNIKYKKD